VQPAGLEGRLCLASCSNGFPDATLSLLPCPRRAPATSAQAEAGDWRPSPASQPAASANDRFLPPVAAEAAGAPVLGSAAAAAGAAVAVNRASADAAPLPYLRVAPPGDLAGQARPWDVSAAEKLPLPL
jgi:hypothetical protein